MTESKKPYIITVIVVFFVSLLIWNYVLIGRDHASVSETSQASLPLLTIETSEGSINQMHGYVQSINRAAFRQSITPFEGDSLKVKIKYGTSAMDTVSYRLYQEDNKTVAEKGAISFKKKVATIKIKERLDIGKTYLLQLILEKDGQEISYYTRVAYGTDLKFDQCLAFAKEFHKQTLASDGKSYISRYLESKEGVTTSDLSEVDITSDQNAVCYAGLNPVLEETYPATVKEVSTGITSVELKSVISSENQDGVKQYYLVTEYYRIRYGSGKVYLLNYERSQEAYMRYDLLDSSNNRLLVGIANSDEKNLKSVSNGKKVALIQQNELWFYNYDDTSMTKVFSFMSEDYREERNNYDQHGIHIIDMKKNGDVTFAVYGYMNRGAHEGANGISIYQFNASDRTTEELIFIPTQEQYESLKSEVEKGMYLSSDEILYFTMQDALYQVDINREKYEIISKNAQNGFITLSSTGMLAVATSDQKMKVTNLDSNESYTISCKDGEVIKPLGFVQKDVVYGIANQKDVVKKEDGSLEFPMKQVTIGNEGNQNEKTYENQGNYVTDVQISGTVITLTPAKKVNSRYRTLDEDYIRYKEKSEDRAIYEYGYTQQRLNQLYLTFPSDMILQTTPEHLTAKISATEDTCDIKFAKSKNTEKEVYVYAGGRLTGTYESMKSAISAAKKNAGVVVNRDQLYAWEKGITKSYGKVTNVSVVKADTKDESAIACIKMMANSQGYDASYKTLAASKKSTFDLLTSTMKKRAYDYTGCSLEDSLYCISKGRPLMVQRKNGTFVLLISYNSTKLRYIDPVKGESVQVNRTTFERELKAAGNVFYSCVN